MICPFCNSTQTFIVNSRITSDGFKTWRRRLCQSCGNRFTTHEQIDMSHLLVIKKSGKKERFSRIKLYSGILWASHGVKMLDREKTIEKITTAVEHQIFALKQKAVTTDQIGTIVLHHLWQTQAALFLRFLSYRTGLTTNRQFLAELKKYPTK